ncbi:MAG: ATP-binding cassette domain-containing protein [Deltaproteobacteria bacterium]|nr:ATP-binding cassette domain-containing protein [Deltaproteobacteria bacterium]
MIEAQGLCMRYGPVTALEDCSFDVRKGEIVGLLGPNGAGKSTAMKILTTFLYPTSGTATVAGHDVLTEPLEVRRRMGALPENLPLYSRLEVGEYLKFVAQARGVTGKTLASRMAWVLERTGLGVMYYRPIGELSKGYRQRTALAQALIHDPDVIILDEPTTGLDPHQILDIRKLVKELAADRTVLFSTHILQEVEAIADRIVIISQGRIVAAGSLAELTGQAGLQPGVEIVIRAEFDSARESLEHCVPGCSVDLARVEGEWSCIRLQGEEPALVCSAVYREAVSQGWDLRSIRPEPVSLESVFLALTRAEKPAAAEGGKAHA